MKIRTKIVNSAATQDQRQQMWELYQNYYQVDKDTFFKRFDTNQYYALYYYNNHLVGFTGIRKKTVATSKGNVTCIYMGQTAIDTRFRNNSLIPKTCVKLVQGSLLSNPFRQIYLWCDSLTYKPYLSFVKSTNCAYPTRKVETPAHIQTIINELGQFYYGDRFNPATGTVRKDINIVTDPNTIITAQDRQHPDIDFFARRNPNYRQGYGLITITNASLGNVLHCAIKCLKKQLRFKLSHKKNLAKYPRLASI